MQVQRHRAGGPRQDDIGLGTIELRFQRGGRGARRRGTGAGHPDGVPLDGRPVGGLSPGAITQAGIGRSFQITNLFPALTVAENVRLAVQSRDQVRSQDGSVTAGEAMVELLRLTELGQIDLIAQGRDAADVPITQTFGPNTLLSFKVWTDEVV